MRVRGPYGLYSQDLLAASDPATAQLVIAATLAEAEHGCLFWDAKCFKKNFAH